MALNKIDDRIVCSDCGSWVRVNGVATKITHSRRCDLNEQPSFAEVAPATVAAVAAEREARTTRGATRTQVRAAAERGMVGGVTSSEDEVVDLVKRGWISETEAMNRDD